MHDPETFVDAALALRGVRGHPYLENAARYAFAHGKFLQVVAQRRNDPELRVIDEPTGRWLSLPIESDDETIENLVDHFDSQYAQLEPTDDYEFESAPKRIVDILLEGDLDDFISGFSREQERQGGRPLDPAPTGKKVLRAVQFETGHRLYVWRTNREREYYGHGQPHSYYLGYRFVSPDGRIIFEDVGFHPGGGWNGDVTDDVLLMLTQGLTLGYDQMDDEDLAKLTPEQKEWSESPDRERIEMDVAGHDGFEQGYPAPWKEIPMRGRRQRS